MLLCMRSKLCVANNTDNLRGVLSITRHPPRITRHTLRGVLKQS